MPTLSAKTKHYHRERIRSLIVQNPHISAEGVRKALDRHYIGKLLTAIHTERAKRADTWTLRMTHRLNNVWAQFLHHIFD
jgi:hypothetical protein